MMKKLLLTLIFIFFALGTLLAQNGEIYGGPAPQQLISTTNSSPPTNAFSTNDGTLFGTVSAGASKQNDFTFTSTISAQLTVTAGPDIDPATGLDAQYFTVSAPSPAILPGLSSSSFSVVFSPDVSAVPGDYVAYIEIQAGNGPFTSTSYFFQVQGTVGVPAPSILVTDEQTNNVDNGTESSFGSAQGNCETVTKTYTITNNGTAPLTINDIYSFNDFNDDGILNGSSVDFVVNLPESLPITIPATNPYSTWSFTVTFAPPQPDQASQPDINYSDYIIIDTETDDPNEGPFSDATDFFFIATGTGTTPTANMDVYGNSELIPGDGSNVANNTSTNDTYFGSVDVNDPTGVTHTFTIINDGGCLDLTLTNLSSLVEITGANPGDFVVTSNPTTPVSNQSPNNTTTFSIRFIPTDSGPRSAVVSIANNSSTNPYTFNIAGDGNALPTEQEMDLFYDDGNTTNPLASGDTVDFGNTDITTGSVSYTFTIENNGGADLNLTDPSPYITIAGTNPSDFTLTTIPSTPIVPSGSTTFVITFNPSAIGIREASVSIANNDSDENPYIFTVQGTAIDANSDSPLMITQYYEGDGNDQWIEVKNISQRSTSNLEFYLALYVGINATTNQISNNAPNQSIAIDPMTPGEVRLYRNSNASLPLVSNRGLATDVSTAVCTFDGKQVILISGSNGTDCYSKRIDIMGYIVDDLPLTTWGENTTFIKGCGTTEQPSTTFDVNDYIELTLDQVNNADPNTNIALGTQTVGPTIWTSSWDNGIPDITKTAIINGTYNASSGSFDACSLTISSSRSVNLDGGTNNFVYIEQALAVNGNFTIGDTESLLTKSGISMSGVINKKETTTQLNNYRDFTYWSSPVNTTISQAFADVNPNRIFEWRKPANGDGYGFWDPVSGTSTMEVARGYIAEAPSSTPDGGTYTPTFTGTPINGSRSIILGLNDDGNPDTDYNLIGNPYPSAIDIDEFINFDDGSNNNLAMDGTIWLWTHNTALDSSGEFLGDDYATYNLSGGTQAGSGGTVPNQFVGSGQGFFVRATSPANAWFTNAMRVAGNNDQFFRGTETKKSSTTDEKDRIWLNITSATGGAFNQILVAFIDKATDGFDRGYDGSKLGGSWINFYSKIDTLKYAIQGLGSFTTDKKVALGFDTYIPDVMTYKISIANIEGMLKDNDVYLIDKELNLTHDLKQSDYEFTVDGTGNFPDRFTLQFTKATLSVDDLNLADNQFVVINQENSLNVRSNNAITRLKVYDMTGRLLMDREPNDNDFDVPTYNIRKGTVLILKATFDNGAEISKKAIKY